MKIYAGNLSRETTEDELKQAFEQFGRVESVDIIKDKYSGQSKGFGFIEMPDDTESRAAMENLNGKDLKGRSITVNEARPRTERPGGRRGHGGGGGRGDGYGGRGSGYGGGEGRRGPGGGYGGHRGGQGRGR